MGFVEPENKKQEHTSTCRLADGNSGADSSIILEFIALRVKALGDSPFVLLPAFNSFLVESTYDCKTQ